MRVKYPIMWFKGLPVGPEVFQQNSLHHEYKLKTFFQSIFPLNWGVINIDFSENDFINGIFKLNSFQGFGPDFTYFEITPEDNLFIELEQYKEELKTKPLYIFVSLPNNEYSTQKNIINPRYNPITIEAVDLNNKEEKNKITFLKPNFALEIGGTNNLQNISIPLYKIIYNGMNYQITDYCFPTCSLKNLKKLTIEISNLVILMKDKITFLKHNQESMENSILLSWISNSLFPLERCLKSNSHPYELYSILIDIIGHTFPSAKNTNLPQIPIYQHNDLYDSMKELISYIKENVKNINVSCIKYKFKQDTFKNSIIFTITPHSQLNNDLLIVGIEKNISAEYRQTQEWMEEAIIASVDNIALTQEQRTIGARRNLIKNFEEFNIPKLENMMIFGIRLDSEFISKNENICIFNPDNNLMPPAAIYTIQTVL